MTEVQHIDHMKPHYYIPHHCIIRPESVSTKLRVVYDASAKTSSGQSLNDILLVGPTIQQDLIITLLSFRLNKFALTADISKMFRQFLVDDRDRVFQLILWRDDVHQQLRTYALNTITYGLASSPFQAVRCLSYIATLQQDTHPTAASVLKQDFYVDDMLTGAGTLEELEHIKTEISSLLSIYGLTLSKWNSNHCSIQTASELQLDLDQETVAKTLGTIWNTKEDLFCFKLPVIDFSSPTKRSVLSTAARIFDILGLLSPIVIRIKILLQEMWIKNISWDEKLPEDLIARWHQMCNDLSNINNISIKRYVFTSPNTKVDIHGFADASQRAYGCCIYVRATCGAETKVSLLIAKSKVAPVKAQSLPRLELCAALLLTITWNKIRFKLEKFVNKTYFWSDSQIVLHWLRMHSSTLNCFVANRISEIQTQSTGIEWRHVPSNQNPADIVSRGCSALELPATIWYKGPDFLNNNEDAWPQSSTNSQIDFEAMNEERRKPITLKCSSTTECIIDDIVNKHSSYMKILRIISYVFRAFNRTPPIKNMQPNSISLSSSELDSTFWKIVAIIQQQAFKDDIDALAKGKDIPTSLRNLTPFLHKTTIDNSEYQILRVGGRLMKAPIAYDAKFPALLPSQNRFSQLYVEFLHRQYMHAGVKALIGILRRQIWIVNGRELARKTVRSCIHCFRYKPILQQQIMGNLPADRLRAQRPFLISGVDFCGPFFTSYRIRGKPPYKTYMAVYVCFSTKAVHFEIVSDLSTNNFLLSLKRFIGRRGMPRKLYCDNATNFVGAMNALKQFQQCLFSTSAQENILAFTNQRGFDFCFIPPRAPHFGGLWEAAVKSAKSLLIKNIGKAHLTLEELQTVAIEAEAILNSRPLCPLSNDPNDGEALTPAHLLIGSSLLAIPDQHFDCSRMPYLSRYQKVAFLKQQFWELWQRDYLHLLQQRSKWLKPVTNVQLGQLVVVHEDHLPPQQWLLGRITNTSVGADGHIRVVEIYTKKGKFKRPIHKIAPLPLC